MKTKTKYMLKTKSRIAVPRFAIKTEETKQKLAYMRFLFQTDLDT